MTPYRPANATQSHSGRSTASRPDTSPRSNTVHMLKVHPAPVREHGTSEFPTHQPPFAPLHGLARASSMSLSVSPKAPAPPLWRKRVKAPRTRDASSPIQLAAHHASLLIRLLARLSGFDSQRAQRTPVTQDTRIPRALGSPAHTLPLPRESDNPLARVRVCSWWAQDGQPCECC